MKKVRLYNPFLKKYKSYDPLGSTAKKIYQHSIDKGKNPRSILPQGINYNPKTKSYSKIKTKIDRKNVRRLTYQQVQNAVEFGKAPISVLREIIKNYAGQTVQFAKKYTDNDEVIDGAQIEDIPPLKGGFSTWWENFSYFFIVESPLKTIFDEEINEGLDPQFQGQVLIMTLDKVNEDNYYQYFMEGITNCLLTPILNWAERCLDDAKSQSAQYNYKRKIKLLGQLEIEYINGVPQDKIPEICNILQIGIEIDLPSTVNTDTIYIRHRSQKKPLKTFKYINTRLNHIELNEVNNVGEFQYISKKKLKELFWKKVDSGEFLLFKESRSNGLKQINTLEEVLRVEPDNYSIAVEEFEDKNKLGDFKLNYYDNISLSQFVINSNHHNGSIQFIHEYDDLIVEHIDMIKSYTRGSECDFYEGYLAKITDFRKTDKIVEVGIYQITNINFNGNKQIEELKVLHNDNAYPSPELKYYQSLGITFDIVGGCWGKTTNIEFTDGMYEKVDGIRNYCKWFGCIQMIQFKDRYNFTCDDVNFAKLNGYNIDCDIRFNKQRGQGVIEYKKKKVFHQSHIASFINSYARINLIKQLLLIKGKIIAVQVDGIYYEGEAELTPLFKDETKFTLEWVCDGTAGYTNDIKGEYDFGESRDFNEIEIHTGAGGCGKTHNNLVDKGLCNVLYVAPSYKLIRNKQEEYNCDACVLAWLIHNDPSKWGEKFRNYSTIIIDEASMVSNEAKDLLIERFEYHRLIFCGDLNFQLPPVMGSEFEIEDYPVIHHNTNRRCKCNKLKKRLDALREGIIRKAKLPKFEKEFMGIDIKDKDDIDYNVNDLIISPINRKKDYYTNKYKDLDKYMILDNTLEYSNGQIVFEKVKGVKSELRHGFTVHSIQGETAKYKLFIDLESVRDLRMIYTAFSRAQYLEQIVLVK